MKRYLEYIGIYTELNSILSNYNNVDVNLLIKLIRLSKTEETIL